MNLYVELKIRQDADPDGFSNGLTLCNSQSTKSLLKISEDESLIQYTNPYGHKIILNKKHRDHVVEVSTTFQNDGEEDVILDMVSSFAIHGVKADKIYRLQSFWSAEGKLRVEDIEELHLEPSWNRCGMRVEKFGNLGSMPVRKYFPFLAVENSATHDFIGIQLYIPSSWQMELLCKEDETLSIVGGIADRDFGHWYKNIAKGESFTTPKAVVACGKSLYEVCDKLVKAQQPVISNVDQEMGIIFNEYCTTWGNPTLDNIKRICNHLKGKGIQYFVIDSGWYGQDGEWWNTIGDWDVNEKKFPGGLEKAAEYITESGMIPGLWYEFEAVGKGSKYYNDKANLLKKDGAVLTVGERRFWDMEAPFVQEHLGKKVIETLKDCGFGYIKVDYNDTIGIGCDGAESLGEGLRRKIVALQKFFQQIREEIPGIVIENCSSGGHRLEPSMMELVSQASFSDAHEIVSIPIIAANMHRVILPTQTQIWAVLRKQDSKARLHYSIVNTFFGRMCLSGDVCDLSAEQWEIIEEGIDFYKEASDIIKDGMTIHCECSARSYCKPKGEQLVIRKYKNKWLVIAHRFEDSKEIELWFLKDRRIIREYGSLEHDFTAKAWILECAYNEDGEDSNVCK